jgi:serine/threonine-protein kinase
MRSVRNADGQAGVRREDVADTLAAVLRGAPDPAALPDDVPHSIRTLVARCLEKDRWKRIADISIALFLIDEASSDATAPETAPIVIPRAPGWRRAIPFVATAALAGAIKSSVPPSGVSNHPHLCRPSRDSRSRLRTGSGSRIPVARSWRCRRTAHGWSTWPTVKCNVRSMSGLDAKPLPGTNIPQGVLSPVFSPDGQSIAFWSSADSTIKRISVDGGPPVTVCPAERPFGIAWTVGGILFGEGPSGLMRVAANGGKPEVLLKVDKDEVADSPQLLPDGETVLFTLATGTAVDRWDRAKIVVWSLKSGQQKTVLEGGSDALYVPSGHLVYAFGGSLFAVPFDVKRLEVTGSAVPVIQGISRADAPGQQTGIAHFSVSSNGSLMYVEGPVSAGINRRNFVRVDRAGRTEQLKLPSGPYEHPRVSPDGRAWLLEPTMGKRRSSGCTRYRERAQCAGSRLEEGIIFRSGRRMGRGSRSSRIAKAMLPFSGSGPTALEPPSVSPGRTRGLRISHRLGTRRGKIPIWQYRDRRDRWFVPVDVLSA